MIVKAYSKVNLILNIIGKRPDGFHEIETFMQAVEPHDDVEVNYSVGRGICFKISSQKLNTADNLAVQAAELMLKEFRKECHIDINIEKRIPVAAGLGGGSSDAAAVITALAKLWNIKDLKKLMQIGSKLGSDVPFCIAACNGYKAAIGRGRGDELLFVTPVKDLKLEIERLNVHIKDKTKSVYAELKKEDYADKYDIEAFMKADTIEEKEKLMGNHLQAPAERLFVKAGAQIPPAPAHMSGAGPAYFKIIK